MKKDEALIVASERLKLINEYLDQFFEYTKDDFFNINITHRKVEGEKICAMDITGPNIEKHFNLGIDVNHVTSLYDTIFWGLFNRFAPSETMMISLTPKSFFMGSNECALKIEEPEKHVSVIVSFGLKNGIDVEWSENAKTKYSSEVKKLMEVENTK